MKGDKVIRDSVHGNIELPKAFVEKIVDTPYFQRLRRIEQTSVRAIYPCARHDRFTHSLGVYHIGTRIVKQLRPQMVLLNAISEHEINIITQSYLIACLLHDIAHAPFSHTFEVYYGDKEDLYERLQKSAKLDLKWSVQKQGSPKEHEYASAIMASEKFGEAIKSHELNGDVELVCRMIIGAEYNDKNKFHQICDCFIKLLHGEVDADRLDYASRDIWASGYKTVNVDVTRIICSMRIREHKKRLNLCFDYHAIGDIRNIMELKWFQVTHIFNHHTIVYDQFLLTQAAEQMAKAVSPEMDPTSALSKIICLEAVSDNKYIPDEEGIRLRNLCDDDLFFLMKQHENEYYEDWSSRQYKHFALWKSPEEFFHLFPNVSKSVQIKHPQLEEKVIDALSKVLDTSKILVREVKYIEKQSLGDFLIVIRGEIRTYAEVCHEIFKETIKKITFKFTYLYLPKPEDRDELDELREEVVSKLTPVINELFSFPKEEKVQE